MQHTPSSSHKPLEKGATEKRKVNASAFTTQTVNALTVCESSNNFNAN